jgi:hypothetical protein
MTRGCERLAIALIAASVAFAIAAATGWSSNSSGQAGFTDVSLGQYARFAHTTTTCVAPKGQIAGGQVTCNVGYVRWQNIFHPVRDKYEVTLTLNSCVEVGKWSRLGTPKLLKHGTVC